MTPKTVMREDEAILGRCCSMIASEKLGLEFEQGPFGSVITTDPMKETSMPGIFACSDAARPIASVALAVGDGDLADAGLHRSLLFGKI